MTPTLIVAVILVLVGVIMGLALALLSAFWVRLQDQGSWQPSQPTDYRTYGTQEVWE